MGRVVLAAALAWAAAMPGAARAEDQSRAIFQSWIGKALLIETPRGVAVGRFDSDGSASLGAPSNDKGSWRWDDAGTGFCTKWKKIRKGEEACFVIDTIDGDHYVVYKGTSEVSARVRLKP